MAALRSPDAMLNAEPVDSIVRAARKAEFTMHGLAIKAGAVSAVMAMSAVSGNRIVE